MTYVSTSLTSFYLFILFINLMALSSLHFEDSAVLEDKSLQAMRPACGNIRNRNVDTDEGTGSQV